MNREIRFKAKDKHGDWQYGHVALVNFYGDFHCWKMFNTDQGKEGIAVDPKTIGQSTGLHDKNGVGIYEGDIVEVADSSCDDLSSRSSHVVEWFLEEDYPAFDLRPAWDSELNSFSSIFNQSCFEIEVIGNIHENPELLENKQ